MSNKISGLNNPALQEAVPVVVPGAAGAGVAPGRSSVGGSSAPEGAAAAAGDVHITDSASQLAALEQTLRSLPAVDEARVAQLRTAIEQGSYTVQPQQVADQLIQVEQALAGLQGG